MPIAEKLYSAQTLPLIVNMISIVCGHISSANDLTGESTIAILKSVRKVAYLLNSNHASSLGPHPAVYFYSSEGRHKSASYMAITDLVSRLSERKKINDFIHVRPKFEIFLLEFDYLIQQINRKYRTAQKSYPFISKFLEQIVDELKLGKSLDEALFVLQSQNFDYLSLQKPATITGILGKKFDTEAKSTIFLCEVIKSAPKCGICNGFLHRNSISIDHIERRQDLGSSSPDNGQITHPYCNTGYKS